MCATNRNLIGLYCYCEFEMNLKVLKSSRQNRKTPLRQNGMTITLVRVEVMLGEREDDTDNSDNDEVKDMSNL